MTRSAYRFTTVPVCAAVLLSLHLACDKSGDTASPADAAGAPDPAPAPAGDDGGAGDDDYEDPLADIDAASEPKKPQMTLEEQLNKGEELYDAKCAGCHGADGEGKGKNPALMGSAGLPVDPPKKAKSRNEKFETAGDVRDFIQIAMPPKSPGSLSYEEYTALTAFLVKANGGELNEPLWDENLRSVKIPARAD